MGGPTWNFGGGLTYPCHGTDAAIDTSDTKGSTHNPKASAVLIYVATGTFSINESAKNTSRDAHICRSRCKTFRCYLKCAQTSCMIGRCNFSNTMIHAGLRSTHLCEMTLFLTHMTNFSLRGTYLSVVVWKSAEETEFLQTFIRCQEMRHLLT